MGLALARNLFDLNETLWCGWIVQHEISEGCPSTGTKGVIDKEALATVNFALRQTVSSVFFGG